MDVILKTKDLTRKYDDRIVVDNLNLEIRKGEIFGLLGPNGAGKSTTMNMICNIVKPTLGSVEFMGEDLRKNSRDLMKHIGFIPQDLAIHNKLKAWENVELFTSLYGIKGADLKKAIDESLDYVGLLERRNDYAGKFSGSLFGVSHFTHRISSLHHIFCNTHRFSVSWDPLPLLSCPDN